MEHELLLRCRYSGDNPSIYGIELDLSGAREEQTHTKARLLADAVRLGPELMPSLYETVKAVSNRLGLSTPVQGYVYNDPGIQAACVHFGGEDKSALMLSSGLINLMSLRELQFVIGHELGHMILNHNIYPRPDDAPTDGARLNWLALKRAGEISADRVGLLACSSIETAFRAILKTGTGLGAEYLRFDLSAFLDQLRNLRTIGGDASGIASSHPVLTVRMKALLWFDISDVGREAQGNQNHGLALKTVDRRVERLLDQATGELLGRVRSESFSKAALWTVLYAAVTSGRLTHTQQRGLAEVFGKEEADSAIKLVKDKGPEHVGILFEDHIREVQFHPSSGRETFLRRLERDLSHCGVETENASRIIGIVGDRLGIEYLLGDAR